MNTAQILGLVHGDIVRLNHRVNAPLDVLCDGVTLTHALIGREGTRLAALVVDQKLETNP
jgi:flagellar motor switch protein FliM